MPLAVPLAAGTAAESDSAADGASGFHDTGGGVLSQFPPLSAQMSARRLSARSAAWTSGCARITRPARNSRWTQSAGPGSVGGRRTTINHSIEGQAEFSGPVSGQAVHAHRLLTRMEDPVGGQTKARGPGRLMSRRGRGAVGCRKLARVRGPGAARGGVPAALTGRTPPLGRAGGAVYEQPGIAEALPPPWAAASWSSPHRVASETSHCPLTLTALPAMPLSMTVPFNEI